MRRLRARTSVRVCVCVIFWIPRDTFQFLFSRNETEERGRINRMLVLRCWICFLLCTFFDLGVKINILLCRYFFDFLFYTQIVVVKNILRQVLTHVGFLVKFGSKSALAEFCVFTLFLSILCRLYLSKHCFFFLLLAQGTINCVLLYSSFSIIWFAKTLLSNAHIKHVLLIIFRYKIVCVGVTWWWMITDRKGKTLKAADCCVCCYI